MGSKHQRKITYHSWFTARPEFTSRLIGKESQWMEKVNGIVEKLDAHYGFFMLTICFSLPKTFYFLRTSTCFYHPALLEKYDKTVRDGLSKVCNVNFDEFSGTQLDLPSKIGSLGVSSPSLLALPPFWPQLLVRVTSSRRVLGNIRRCIIYKSAWEMVEFDQWTRKSSRWSPEKLDTTCLRQDLPRIDF